LPEQVSGQFNQQKIEKVLDFLEIIDSSLPKESAVIRFDGAVSLRMSEARYQLSQPLYSPF